MKLRFNYYLHDDSNGAEHEEYADELVENGCEIPLEDLYKWFDTRPFYEITIHIEYDTETCEFEIVGCS